MSENVSKPGAETPVGDPGKPEPQQPKQLMIPISIEEIELVQGLPRKQRKLWSKRIADEIYKLVRHYRVIPNSNKGSEDESK